MRTSTQATSRSYIKIFRTKPNFGGLVGVLLFWWASLTPSLLPRVWYLQAVISGISISVGYALGLCISKFIRFITRHTHRPEPRLEVRRAAWQLWATSTIVLGSVALALSLTHQRQLRILMGLPPDFAFNALYIVFGSLVIFIALLVIARTIRWFSQRLNYRLDRYVPEPVADALTVAVVVGLLLGLGANLAFREAKDWANTFFKLRDTTTIAGVHQPNSSMQSGSQTSLVKWDELGKQGRSFVAKATSPSQLQAFSRQSAIEPIRVYAGLRSANSLNRRAAIVERELERTGAYNRAVLLLTTTTGTGWIDPDAPTALEYMFNGNSAVAGMQYSYLPSWISFLADRNNAASAAQVLIQTVYEHWRTLPVSARPKLIIFGESLGAFGSQTAFSSVTDIVAKTDGVFWVGPPNASGLWHSLTTQRDNGSPEWRPVYNHGQTVRFSNRPSDMLKPSANWPSPRVMYLQYASDPVVWLNTQLMYREPDWLKGSRGYDVSPQIHWYPFVSWAQMVVDLTIAGNVPAGHGHVYNGDIYNGLALVTQPPNWTLERTQALRHYMHL